MTGAFGWRSRLATASPCGSPHERPRDGAPARDGHRGRRGGAGHRRRRGRCARGQPAAPPRRPSRAAHRRRSRRTTGHRSRSTARSATTTSTTTAATTCIACRTGPPAGTEVTLRLRAAAGDLSEATVRVWDSFQEAAGTRPDGGRRDRSDAGSTATTTGRRPFRRRPRRRSSSTGSSSATGRQRATSRTTSRRTVAPSEAATAGPGSHSPTARTRPGRSTSTSRTSTPAWTRGAVVYQIFPDRFFNGDPSNDPSPDAKQGEDGAALYRTATCTAATSCRRTGRTGRRATAAPTRGLVRRTAARARLLRRRPGWDHRQARRPAGTRRHGAVPQSDLRRALEPPLRRAATK